MNAKSLRKREKCLAEPETNALSYSMAPIAERAYELNVQRGRKDGQAVQDWEQAKRGIFKIEPSK